MHDAVLKTMGAGALLLGSVLGTSCALADSQVAGDQLKVRETTNELIYNGVTTSADDRVFAVFPHIDGSRGLFIGEFKEGQVVPYPNPRWNQWVPGEEVDDAFVSANAVRVGPDGHLWVVDTGSPARDGQRVKGGARVVQIDLSSNEVVRQYPLDDALPDDGAPNDIRFNDRRAYITDSGHPGLVVLNLDSGEVRRVLNDDPSTTAQHPSRFDGDVLTMDGEPARVNADQLEVSPDHQWLYFQPAAGPMSRVPTRALDDASLSPEALAQQVEHFADTPPTGGTAIDGDGNLYVSDVDAHRIWKITPAGEKSVLIDDPRLVWIDAMWIDTHGELWLPDAQLGRTAPYNDGQSLVKFPLEIYSLPIGAPQQL